MFHCKKINRNSMKMEEEKKNRMKMEEVKLPGIV
jgi:hypothetical protein